MDKDMNINGSNIPHAFSTKHKQLALFSLEIMVVASEIDAIVETAVVAVEVCRDMNKKGSY